MARAARPNRSGDWPRSDGYLFPLPVARVALRAAGFLGAGFFVAVFLLMSSG
jgi:hypothetical protein